MVAAAFSSLITMVLLASGRSRIIAESFHPADYASQSMVGEESSSFLRKARSQRHRYPRNRTL
jgi:hypothetical protein